MKKNRFKILQGEFIKMMNEVKNPTFMNLVTHTIPKMNKGGREGLNKYYGKVVKKKSVRVLIGGEYEQRVKGNEIKGGGEGNFQVSENKVGNHINNVILYNENTKKYYLQYEWFMEVKPKVEFEFEGNPIDQTLFESWLVKSNNYKNQPSERKVQTLSVSLDNVKEVSYNGNIYEFI